MNDNIGPGTNDYGRKPIVDHFSQSAEIDDLRATFDLFQKADERARDMWRKETGKELESPGREDLIIYLMRKLDDVSAQLGACKKAFYIAQEDLEAASARLSALGPQNHPGQWPAAKDASND